MGRRIIQQPSGDPLAPETPPTEALSEEIAFLSKVKENGLRIIEDNKAKISELGAIRSNLEAVIDRLRMEARALEAEVDTLVRKKFGYERENQDLIASRDDLLAVIKEKSNLLSEIEIKGKSAKQEQKAIDELTRGKTALLAVIADKESYLRLLERGILNGEDKNKSISAEAEARRKTIIDLENKITELRAKESLLAPIILKFDMSVKELEKINDVVNKQSKELARLNDKVKEKTSEVEARLKRTDELDRLIAEKEKALSIITEILDFRARKKEVDDAKKMLV